MHLKIKPVFTWLIHSGAYEGPCRWGDLAVDSETERAQGKQLFGKFYQSLKEKLTKVADLLEPAYIEWAEDWTLSEPELRQIEADLHEIDLFLVCWWGISEYPAIKLAERYRKPVAMVGMGDQNVDMAAYLRARGLEGFAPLDFDELNHLISLLAARKAFQETKILVVTDGRLMPVGVVSNVWDLENIRRRFGIEFECLCSAEIFTEMDELIQSEAEQEKVKRITERLIKNAQNVRMEKEYIIRSVSFYLAVKRLMTRYGCNAFVIPCFELCVKRIPAKRKVTFCLAHSLLKDEGFPSACEGDINALLAMTLLMYISKKSAYMGNSILMGEEDMLSFYFGVPSISGKRKKNIMTLLHDVPGLKMKGFDEPALPYEIRSFTAEGWGATIRYDFSRDRGDTVTLARFNPTATKLLVAKGEIAGGGGLDEVGCSLRVNVRVADVVDLFHKEADFGHHLVMVYGDYAQELKDLGILMGFEVVEA